MNIKRLYSDEKGIKLEICRGLDLECWQSTYFLISAWELSILLVAEIKWKVGFIKELKSGKK